MKALDCFPVHVRALLTFRLFSAHLKRWLYTYIHSTFKPS